MKKICFYFQVHQPYRLKKYRFFNLGKDHFYFDDFLNRMVLERIAENSYIPMNSLLLDLINQYGDKVKVSFSISGTAIEQFEEYTPSVLDSFVQLSKTKNVEYLAETYSHSLASLKDQDEFYSQVKKHTELVKEKFGTTPTAFRNTELIYSDHIGELVSNLGFNIMLTEGSKNILGWKSPNYLYSNPIKQRVKLLLRNYRLSDDIAFRFPNREWCEYPLDAEKYLSWLRLEQGEVINLFMDYETFGEHIKAENGIFEFMRALIAGIISDPDMELATPTQVANDCQSMGLMFVPHPISWADEERDLSAWLGNDLQNEAFNKLYALRQYVIQANDSGLDRVWQIMQESDHFYYMCTKWFQDGQVHSYFNPFDSPYEAFMNYMNVLSDFEIELKKNNINIKY